MAKLRELRYDEVVRRLQCFGFRFYSLYSIKRLDSNYNYNYCIHNDTAI
jgi:hypothetical protein